MVNHRLTEAGHRHDSGRGGETRHWGIVAGFLSLLWWLPAILLKVAGLLLDRARFRAAIGLGRALAGVGLTGAARAVFSHECRRAKRRMAEIRARRGRVASLRDEA